MPAKDKSELSKGRRTRRVVAPSDKPIEDHERCGAHTRNGNKCKSRKGAATDHPGYGNCTKHGGNTEAGIKSAMREMGHDLIFKYKSEHAKFGGDRNDPSIANMTPESALLEEVRRSAAMVRFLEERIAMWNMGEVQTETLERFVNAPAKKIINQPSREALIREILDGLPHEDPDSPAHLPPLTAVDNKTGISSFTDAREWLYLYREERGHLARTAKMCIDAGVAQRLVSLAEDQGRILATAIRAILGALSLTPEQQALIPYIVPPVLRAVAHDQPVPNINTLLENVPVPAITATQV